MCDCGSMRSSGSTIIQIYEGHQSNPGGGDGAAAPEGAFCSTLPQFSAGLTGCRVAELMACRGRSASAQDLGVMPAISGSFPPLPDVVLNWC